MILPDTEPDAVPVVARTRPQPRRRVRAAPRVLVRHGQVSRTTPTVRRAVPARRCASLRGKARASAVSDLILDDLELELRKLPGVRAAGFDARDDLLIVQLHVVPGAEAKGRCRLAAPTRIAARHARPSRSRSRSCAGATLRAAARGRGTGTHRAAGRSPPRRRRAAPRPTGEHPSDARCALLAVLVVPRHRRARGAPHPRRPAHDRPRAGEPGPRRRARRDALPRSPISSFTFAPTPRWARALESTQEEALIAVALDEGGPGERVLYGVASGATPIDAAATGDARRDQPQRLPLLLSVETGAASRRCRRGRSRVRSRGARRDQVTRPFAPYQPSWPKAENQNARRLLSRPVPERTRS